MFAHALIVSPLYVGLCATKQPSRGRIVGVTLTFAVLVVGGALLIWCFVRNVLL